MSGPVVRRPVREPGPPPACPDGWSCGPPDFVGVGAQRCGTTRWFDLLVGHPQVVAPPGTRKELHFFDRYWAGGFDGAEDVARYAAHFPRPPGALTGEWTPTYLHDPWISELLAEAAPEARVLVLLRDPVQRWVSGMTRHVRADGPVDHAAAHEELARGLYSDALDRLFAVVGRERVLVQLFEACAADPAAELARTLAFLGLEPYDADFGAWPNRQRRRASVDARVMRSVAEWYQADVARLAALCPELDLGRWGP